MKTETKNIVEIALNWLGISFIGIWLSTLRVSAFGSKIYWLIIIILLLHGCGLRTPPTELAPNGEIVQSAIALQLIQTEKTLAQQLNLATPEIKISNIRVQKIKPLFVAQLATYHLQGKYNLKLKLSHRQIAQKNNSFDIYLQRQSEGKTWRLLRKESQGKQKEWSSYLVDLQAKTTE